jgi:hypothetical protein
MVQMCVAASVTRIVTLTIEQPRALADDAVLSDWTVPEGFEDCDPLTHVYWHERSSSFRWMRIGACVACCRWVSRALRLWVKRVRRQWPGFQNLHVKESHKSGALHLHVAVTGVPASITRFSRGGAIVKGAWQEVGGGFCDVGRHGSDSPQDAGWYVGKYVAKRQDHAMASRRRRWSRSANFGAEVRMRPAVLTDPDSWAGDVAGLPVRIGPWLDPWGAETGQRWWPSMGPARPPATPATARLDTSTAKWPRLVSVRADLAAWRASWEVRRQDEGVGVCCPAPAAPEPVQTVAFDAVQHVPRRSPAARRRVTA